MPLVHCVVLSREAIDITIQGHEEHEEEWKNKLYFVFFVTFVVKN